jgi:hypothetical protein
MEPILPPTFVSELNQNRNRLSNVERNISEKAIEPFLVNQPASINFIKYSRDNTNFDGSKDPSKVDRIQSNWVSLPYSINIPNIYVIHKTEHLNTESFQDFYRCQIVISTNDLQNPIVISEFAVSLNKFNNLRSNPKAGLWQDTPLDREDPNEEYFQYEKQMKLEIKLDQPITIPANQRFSLIKYPMFARSETFSETQDLNLDIDVVVFNGFSQEPINITVESTLIKKANSIPEPEPEPEPGEDIDPGPLRIGRVRDMAVDADGKYVVVGSFSSACQEPVTNVVRINPDGTYDDRSEERRVGKEC